MPRRSLLVAVLLAPVSLGAQERIPHNQDRPPNRPYTPAEALARMTVPEGFTVELVAAEPDLVNPIAMAFDARGRIWVTESLEYPRSSAGPGRDRIKVLEDTDRDGRVDKVTVFADGLNIPSGLAVGPSGVWVANAPDILLLRDTDGDLKADEREVIATGFGRHDTHELPNAFTWGPDGCLYGLNGVFNPCRVTQDLDRDGKPDGGREWLFTCAMFRIDPRTKRFDVFCEGTSNPWGIAFDGEGSAFVSACVIDHLWHLVETGYYHRQGGPYPPFTWKLGSIVDYKHQKAAYCGITWFDSDAYPEEYRGRLYMGNIHGNCINADGLRRDGSSYRGVKRPDFLTANDTWFMPVAQKTGPDGCLYVLDWYDRYHCYQDARRDPEGIDRGKGRLYRIRYRGAPRAPAMDLAAETDAQLVARLGGANVLLRGLAQRELATRDAAPLRERLEGLVLDAAAPRRQRLHALWAMLGTGRLREGFHARLLADPDATFRAWAVRSAGNSGASALRDAVLRLATDPAPDVRLQVAIAAGKLGAAPIPALVTVLAHSDGDPVIPNIVWQNLHPRLERGAAEFLDAVRGHDLQRRKALAALLPRATERILAGRARPATVAGLLDLLTTARAPGAARQCLQTLTDLVRRGEIAEPAGLWQSLQPRLTTLVMWASHGNVAEPELGRLTLEAALVSAGFRDPDGLRAAAAVFADGDRDTGDRLRALDVLVAVGADGQRRAAATVLRAATEDPELQAGILGALGRLADPEVAAEVLGAYGALHRRVQPRALELLTQRAAWRAALLAAVEGGAVPAGALNGNQIRALAVDAALRERSRKVFGVVRERRDPARQQAIDRVTALLGRRRGDALAGAKVFAKVCAQCHKLHGEGADLGPDLTRNGRGSLEQLLSNVLDPNLVIGDAYRIRAVETKDGRVIGGMLAEDNARRVVVQVLGGAAEVIPRKDVEEITVSPLSFMPEGLELGMSERELLDLFALLTLDGAPDDPTARLIPGMPRGERASTDPKEFDAIAAAVAPGFHVAASGVDGVALLAEHRGRRGVLRTHPVTREAPCVLVREVAVPETGGTVLAFSAGRFEHRSEPGWRLKVVVAGETLHDAPVDVKSAPQGWVDVRVDLGKFAGRRVRVELHNAADDWAWEFGYWHGVRFER